MDLTCYLHPSWAPLIRPAPATRPWMDQTPESFAYRCLPLNIANAHGWEVLSPCGFEAVWNGGTGADAVALTLDPEASRDHAPVSLFGQGVLTFHIEGLFKTPPGWNLWIGGSPNRPKDGISPLSGVVETDWSPFTFTMNWRFTRPRHPVRFDAMEPIGFLFPVQRGVLETVAPRFAPLADDPALSERFLDWSRARDAFHQQMAESLPRSGADKWQKHYYRGVDVGGQALIDDHRTKLRLRPFDRTAAPTAPQAPPDDRDPTPSSPRSRPPIVVIRSRPAAHGETTAVAHDVFEALDGAGADIGAREALGDTALYSPLDIDRALSHRALWRRCAQSGAPLTICDDAAVLRRDFEVAHARLLTGLTDFDLVLWGWDPSAHLTAELSPGLPVVIAAAGGATREAVDGFRHDATAPTLLRLKAAPSAVCYTISPPGAAKLLEGAGLDSLMGADLGDIAAFAAVPPLAIRRAADRSMPHDSSGAALAALQSAAKAAPSDAALWGRLGAALVADGRLAAAGAAFERAVALAPDDPAALYNLAALRLRQARLEDAVALLQAVMTRDPGFDLAYSNYGVALLGLGRPEEAAAAFRRALDLNPGLDEARRGLAMAATKVQRGRSN